jgi:hypothetical protein
MEVVSVKRTGNTERGKTTFRLKYKTKAGKMLRRKFVIPHYHASDKPPSTIQFNDDERSYNLPRKRIYYFLEQAQDKKAGSPRQQRIIKRRHHLGFVYWTVENLESKRYV